MFEARANRVVLLLIITLQLFEFCASLKQGDTGVCEDIVPDLAECISSNATICALKKLQQNKRRARGRIQKHVTTVCCSNYEYDSDQDRCLPVCYTPCINGTCVGVNECACTPPLTLYNNTICVPSTCDNCEHGDCMAPNVCRCHKNYLMLNGTCVPVCDNVCVNGKCAAPNECKCNDGYKPDPNDPYNCIPICDPACENGTCVAHNKCICGVGYGRTKDYWRCKPTCAGCEYGDCISPNNCVCFNGYDRIDSTCKPKCSSCVNGDCVAPEVCRCHEGYELVGGHCSPICSPPCVNGECVSPNNCSCNDGYDSRDFGVCEPYCSKNCINGHCSAPDFCTCNDGYVHDETDYSLCVKPCIRPCKNGHCSPSSGECFCDLDFEYDNDTESCIPMKPVPCEDCEGKCDNVTKECRCLNVRPCHFNSEDMEVPAEVVASDEVKMAGMNMTLMAIGGACLLLLILVVVVMQRLWHKRNDYTATKPTHENSGLGSVVYTVPNTLISQRASGGPMDEDSGDDDETTDGLIRRNTQLS
ncbi:unnamed protein product [Spodoptera exigua]|nr:unnamed protein product [Spodoptera exigua]